MEKLSYEVLIEATPQKVWQVLWGPDSYSQWTYYFSPNSSIHSDWQVNGKTLFLDADRNGMLSTIERLEEFKVVIFKHLGMVWKGVEDLDSEEVKKWHGALEKYFLEQLNGKTRLWVEVDILKEYREMMENGFKKGFEIVKQLAEA
ncbi:SRPBCC domain-containing protein [Acinetobacter sp. BSP-28]|uniref:SRPBCC family protein n=1 Tax=Acinetobacter sp. BSP-28 TaxID=3344661 RepID=UPI0037705EC7